MPNTIAPAARLTAALALALLLAALVGGASPAQAAALVVDDDPANCVDGTAPDHATITAAIAASSFGQTIRVCEGDYTENTFTINQTLTITGPGATPQIDGVATVHHGPGGSSAMFSISADDVVIEGLDIDAAPPPGFGFQTGGMEISGDRVIIQDNEIHHSTQSALSISGGDPQVIRNNIHDTDDGIVCFCQNGFVSGNTVDVGGGRAIEISGQGGTIFDNTVLSGDTRGHGDGSVVNANQLFGNGATTTLSVSGDPVTVSNNTISDADA
jgi:hypothetical protein